MTRKRYEMETTIGFDLAGVEQEWPVRIWFTYIPGRPALPPAYSHGGIPADPAEVVIDQMGAVTADDGKVKRVQYFRPGDPIFDWAEANESLLAVLLEYGSEQAADDYAEAMERRAESRREE